MGSSSTILAVPDCSYQKLCEKVEQGGAEVGHMKHVYWQLVRQLAGLLSLKAASPSIIKPSF